MYMKFEETGPLKMISHRERKPIASKRNRNYDHSIREKRNCDVQPCNTWGFDLSLNILVSRSKIYKMLA